jgi:hypothetical protein
MVWTVLLPGYYEGDLLYTAAHYWIMTITQEQFDSLKQSEKDEIL